MSTPPKPPRVSLSLLAMAHDATMAAFSFMLSVYLRLGEDQLYMAAPYFTQGTAMFTGLSVSVFVYLRLYRGLWRYASMQDCLTILRAVTASIVLFAALMFLVTRLEGMPRSVLFINWFVLSALLIGPRFLYRALKDQSLTRYWQADRREAVPVLLIGAGDQAELFVRETERDSSPLYRVVAIVEDDIARIGRTLHGIRIYGPVHVLETIVNKLARKNIRPQRIILSDDAVEGEALRHLVSAADRLGLTLGRLPRLHDLKSGQEAERTAVKAVAVEDLLKRPQYAQDKALLLPFIEGKRVLITGAGGTIGSELARQVAGFSPKTLILFEQSEYALYGIEQELSEKFANITRVPVLADVRDMNQVEGIFREWTPEIVLHAAAIKHVPLAEANVLPTLATNILGTHNIAKACLKYGTGIMLLISTDKAVNPTNVMGASKRAAEKLIQAFGNQEKAHLTRFVAVRFGNVLGSTGSVVPLFARQIAEGGPVTVTHAEMTRFFMTVREAVELVLTAAAMSGKAKMSGTFVLDMGEPVKIVDLARQMVRLAGLRPDIDIPITFSGLRPGEKLYEELFYAHEASAPTGHAGILRAGATPVEWNALQKTLDSLEQTCRQRNVSAAVSLLQALVPEYAPDSFSLPLEGEGRPAEGRGGG